MAAVESLLKPSDRVRVNEGEPPYENVGRMATVRRVEMHDDGDRLCVIRIDRQTDEVTLPERYLEKVEPRPSTLLANDLFLPWDMDNPRPRLSMFLDSPWIRGRLLEGLLYYDRIVAPTVDFAVIVPMVHWMGAFLFRDLLAANAISFVRYQGGLSYVGNGVGLSLFELGHEDPPDEKWWVTAACSSPEDAATLQLKNRLTGLAEPVIEVLPKLVALCTVDTAIPEFDSRVGKETYLDIMASPLLWPNFENGGNLRQLPGLDADQMRVFSRLGSPAVVGDSIDITLRLAMLNLEAYLADEAGARDMVTDRGFAALLNAKAGLPGSGQRVSESFARIQTVDGVPDIAAGLESGEIDSAKLWEFRQSGLAQEFRQWFDETGPENPDQLIKEYGRALRDQGLLESARAKAMRFILVTAAGIGATIAAPPIAWLASMGLSAVDGFLISKIRLGFNPRYFVDELNHRFFED